MTEETNNHDGRSQVGVEIPPVPISAVKKNKAGEKGLESVRDAGVHYIVGLREAPLIQ